MAFYVSYCRLFSLTFFGHFLNLVNVLLCQVVNKWLALQAMSDIPGNVENVRKLLKHPSFDLRNPNKAGGVHLNLFFY